MWKRILLFGLVLLVQAGSAAPAQQPGNLPGTAELTWDGDLSARMVAGIDRFLMRRLEAAPEERAALWERDFSSGSDYARSVEANRKRFRKIIGVVDRRSPARLEFLSAEGGVPLAVSDSVTVRRVRWDVVAGLGAEGLLVRPRNRTPIAQVIALPDADVTPRQLVGLQPGVRPEDRFALRLAESGCQVIVPALVDRGSRFSGNPALETGRPAMTNMPHREWLYRMAYPMGRHPIGYEVQKVLALVDWLESTSPAGNWYWRGRPRRGRLDRALCRGGGPENRFLPGERLFFRSGAHLAGADLPQCLGPADRVRRRRDREPGAAPHPGDRALPSPSGGGSSSRRRGPQAGGGSRQDRDSSGRVGDLRVRAAQAVGPGPSRRGRRPGQAGPPGSASRDGPCRISAGAAGVAGAPGGGSGGCGRFGVRSRSAPGRLPTRSGSRGAWCATSKGRCRTSCESPTASGTNAIWSEPAGSRPSPSPENRPAGAPPSGRSSWARSRTP